MKLLNNKIIEYFGTDNLTEEFVKNYILKGKEALLLNGREDTPEQMSVLIDELNSIQKSFPKLRVNIAFLNIKSAEEMSKIVSNLDGKIINSLTLNGNFKNANLQNLKKYDNLKSLLLMNENGENSRLSNIVMPENLETLHTKGLDIDPKQIDTLLQNAQKGNTNEKKEISIVLNNMSELPLEKLNELEKYYKIKSIRSTDL